LAQSAPLFVPYGNQVELLFFDLKYTNFSKP